MSRTTIRDVASTTPCGGVTRQVATATMASSAVRHSVDAEFARWMAKYKPVERAILEARAKHLASVQKLRDRKRRLFSGMCEATEGRVAAWRRMRLSPSKMMALAGGDVLVVNLLLSYFGKVATLEADALRHSLKRPLYYERENARRKRLAKDRRKVTRRTTTNPCPTRDDVLEAWTHVKDSREAMLRFGGMMEDLECYVDNSLRFDDAGEVVGRNPGIKGWLQLNVPVLWLKYKTVMRYKAAAKKMRQIVGLADPMPVSNIIAESLEEEANFSVSCCNVEGNDNSEISMRTKSYYRQNDGDGDVFESETGKDDGRRRKLEVGNVAVNAHMSLGCKTVEVLRARALYLEAMDGVPDNVTRTITRIDELLNPEYVEDTTMLNAWKGKYKNEITVRTKNRWMKRLFKRTG